MNYIFYTHNFNINSGGSSFMFKLCLDLQNNLSNNYFIAPIFCDGDGLIRHDINTEFDNHGRTIMPIENINDNYFNKTLYNWDDKYKNLLITKEILLTKNNIAIYGEGIVGNPLQQKYVIRWICYFPTPGLPIDPNYSWGKNDKFLFWGESYYNNIDKHYRTINEGILKDSLHYPDKDDILFFRYLFIHDTVELNTQKFKNNIRSGSCYLIRKADINYNRTFNNNWNDGYQYNNNCPFMKPKPPVYIHPSDSINIDNYQIEELINIFQQTEYLYCYDLYTFHNCLALLYGCNVIMCIPQGKITKEGWHCNDKCYLDYVSWGNSSKELIKAKKNLENINYSDIIKELLEETNEQKIIIFNKINEYFLSIKDIFILIESNEQLICDGKTYKKIDFIYENYYKKYTCNYVFYHWEISCSFIIHNNDNDYSNLFDLNYNINTDGNIGPNIGPRIELDKCNLGIILGNDYQMKGYSITNNIKLNTNYQLIIEYKCNKLITKLINTDIIEMSDEIINNYDIINVPHNFSNIIVGKGFCEERYFNGIIHNIKINIYN
jgi:hypothetical protein